MIDSLHLFPNFDEEQGVSSKPEFGKTPSLHELNKDVPVFSLGGSRSSMTEQVQSARPNPMDMMQDRNANLVDPEVQEELRSEELEEQINNLKARLWEAQTIIESHDPAKLAEEHLQAFGVIIDLVNKDLHTIAEQTQQQLGEKKPDLEEKSVTRRVIDWVSSGEEILNRALLYFSDRDGKQESLVDFLKVQYAVQRATQRAELFSSIVSTTVSSVKTIMTTQLG